MNNTNQSAIQLAWAAMRTAYRDTDGAQVYALIAIAEALQPKVIKVDSFQENPKGPSMADVDALAHLFDLMQNFRDNDQRARYLLSSDWMRTQLGDQS